MPEPLVPRIDQEVLQRLEGHTVAASISGGKDSAAMSLWLAENGVEHLRVFADTGWEHPKTYEYLRGPLQEKIGPIIEVKGERQMEDLIRHKGMFPSRMRRFCTQELKVFPLAGFVKGLGVPAVNAVGLRAQESAARAKLAPWEWQDTFDCPVWRPILSWTEDEVIAIHRRHGLPPNPLYLEGAARVGCWPCIFARKGELAHLDRTDPDRVERMREMEREVQDAARRRYAAKGETYESLGYERPTWFQARIGKKDNGTRDGRPWPLDRVLRWAKTAHGGKQGLLFPEDGDDVGCMKWGMCEGIAETAHA